MTNNPDEEIIHDKIDTETDQPAVEVAKSVARIENTEAIELTSMYRCIDGVLDNIFADPPSSEAQMQIVFSYENFRITVEQDGRIQLVKIGESC